MADTARPAPIHLDPQNTAPDSAISDADIEALKKRFVFLQSYSNAFIRTTRPENLVKLENTMLKMSEVERGRDTDDRLAANRAALTSNRITIPAGDDDRTSVLHQGRFLPGACCPATRLWLNARQHLGLTGAAPLGNYDMAYIGLGGMTTSKGWVELANPGSAKLSVRYFNINNCNRRVCSSKDGNADQGEKDFQEVGEFQLALRTLRNATTLVHPWKLDVITLENFLISNKFCAADISGLERQASILTQFTDYVLGENACKWRDNEPFLSCGELKNAWHAFFGALPQSQLIRPTHQPSSAAPAKQNKKFGSHNNPGAGPRLPYIPVCYNYNKGYCNNPPGVCKTRSGKPLAHVCDHRTDPADLSKYCGLSHRRMGNH
jgi:hypothetical protein